MFMHLFIDARGIIINEMDAHIREYIYMCVCVCLCVCYIGRNRRFILYSGNIPVVSGINLCFSYEHFIMVVPYLQLFF